MFLLCNVEHFMQIAAVLIFDLQVIDTFDYVPTLGRRFQTVPCSFMWPSQINEGEG